jgi:nitrite reductase/ring-hydroxylating ferredoxin subunit
MTTNITRKKFTNKETIMAVVNVCFHQRARLHESKLNSKKLGCRWHGTK